MTRTHQLFISHAATERDSAWVDALTDALNSYSTVTWTDSVDLDVGEDWEARARELLESSTGFVIVVSDASSRSARLQFELGAVLQASAERGAPILPVFLDRSAMKGTLLGELQGLDAQEMAPGEIARILASALTGKSDDALDHSRPSTELQPRTPSIDAPSVRTVSTMSYGIEVVDPDSGDSEVLILIHANDELPATARGIFGTTVDGQSAISFVLLEAPAASAMATDLKYWSTVLDLSLEIGPQPAGAPFGVVLELLPSPPVLRVRILDEAAGRELETVVVDVGTDAMTDGSITSKEW